MGAVEQSGSEPSEDSPEHQFPDAVLEQILSDLAGVEKLQLMQAKLIQEIRRQLKQLKESRSKI